MSEMSEMLENYSPENVKKVLFDKDYENSRCVDCRSGYPEFVSINNGVLLCKVCAEKHFNFGYNISYVRPLTEAWDPYLFCYLCLGGNSRYIRFYNKYALEKIPVDI